ncbi:ribonuclease H-like domain-containing protein [Rubripirellula sp.]|nr:ribonuclease H-like domain-containing protein [Rubripirellula sp.]
MRQPALNTTLISNPVTNAGERNTRARERNTDTVLTLTPDRAKRALYIDFEGEGIRGDGEIPPPVMLGIYCRDGCPSHRVQILESTLKPLVHAGFSSECFDHIEAAIHSLLDQARSEDRDILYFSQHEQDMVNRFCSHRTANEFTARSGNAKLLLKRWVRRTGKARCHTLEDYCQVIDRTPYEAPKPSVAEAIRRLRKASGTARRWRHMESNKKKLAKQLFAYNKQDCLALFKLTKKAANCLNRSRLI